MSGFRFVDRLVVAESGLHASSPGWSYVHHVMKLYLLNAEVPRLQLVPSCQITESF